MMTPAIEAAERAASERAAQKEAPPDEGGAAGHEKHQSSPDCITDREEVQAPLHGAGAEAWAAAIDGGWGDHLLPVVCDPDAKVSAKSKLQGVGKLPSQYTAGREVVGFKDWTTRPTTPQDLTRWRGEPDYGFCVRTGGARDGSDPEHFGGACLALDVDVDDKAKAQQIIARAIDLLGPAPMRLRGNSPRAVLLYRIAGRVPKRRFLVQGLDKAAVELLGDGQQVLLAGRHPSGAHYEVLNADGMPALPALADVPALTLDRLNEAWSTLRDEFAAEGSAHEASSAAAITKPRHKTDIADPFLDALYAAGAVLDDTPDGKAFVECPNAAAHSSDNGVSQTAYLARGLGGIGARAVHCMHAGCAGRSLLRELAELHGLSAELDAVLSAEGRGPASADEFADASRDDDGLSPEERLAAEKEAERVARRNANRPAAVVLETRDERDERRERERQLAQSGEHAPVPTQRKMTGSEMLAELVLIEEGSRVAFINRPRSELPLAEFKVAFGASKGAATNAAGKQTIRHLADLWAGHAERKTVRTTTFAPGRPAVCQSPDGSIALNRWRDYDEAPPANWRELAQPVLDHIAYLVPVLAERERFTDWLAHIAQRPGELPSTHYLMVAKQTGIGRNWLAYALARAFTGYTALGFDLAEALRSGFNGALGEKVLVVVDELHEGGPRQSGHLGEKLKSMLTEATRNVNPKYGRQRVEFNAGRFLMFSNHDAALPLADNDRRVVVIENPSERRSADYYAGLYALLDVPGFGASIREALRQRDIGGFNPGEPAPTNAAKARAIRAGRSEVEQTVRDVAETWPSDCITVARMQYEVQEALGAKVSITGAVAGLTKRRARMADGRRPWVLVVRASRRWLDAGEGEVRTEVERGEAAEGTADADFA